MIPLPGVVSVPDRNETRETMSETIRERAIAAAERQVRYIKAIRWTDPAGNWDVEFAADRCVALADSEVAAASVELQKEVDRLSAECDELRGTVLECRRDQQAAATRMSEALKLIAAGGCESRTSGSCVTDQSRSPIAQYTAERWCDACIAAHALGRSSDRAALAGEVNPDAPRA